MNRQNWKKKQMQASLKAFLAQVSYWSAIKYLASVVRRYDSTIHRKNHIQKISAIKINGGIHWNVVYTVDRAIPPLNNQGLV